MSSCLVDIKTTQRPFTLKAGVNFWKNDHVDFDDINEIKVHVHFRAEKIGTYGQEVIFDFGGFPKVVKKIIVHVETEESLTKVCVIFCVSLTFCFLCFLLLNAFSHPVK